MSIAPEIDKYTKGGNVRIKLRAVWDGRLIRVKYLDEMCATVFLCFIEEVKTGIRTFRGKLQKWVLYC